MYTIHTCIHTLLLVYSRKAVCKPSVACFHICIHSLCLQNKLYPVDWCTDCLADNTTDSSREHVAHECHKRCIVRGSPCGGRSKDTKWQEKVSTQKRISFDIMSLEECSDEWGAREQNTGTYQTGSTYLLLLERDLCLHPRT